MSTIRPLLLAAALLATASPATAESVTVGSSIVVSSPWSREMPPSAPAQGGFLVVENKGTTPDRLKAVSAEISKVMEVHEMAVVDGVMKMRALGDGLEIPAGGKVELKPGSYHLMFIDLTARRKAGETFKARVVFEKAGPVDLVFKVAPLGAKSADDTAPTAAPTGHDHGHGHGEMKKP